MALAARGQGDELDRTPREWAGYVASKLKNLRRIIFDQPVVVLRLARRDHMIPLVQEEVIVRIASVEIG